MIRSSLRRRRSLRLVSFVSMGAGLVTACHQAALAQQSAAPASGSASAGSFDLWSEIGSKLQQFGPAGLLVLGLLAFVGWVVSQAENLEKVFGWFRGRKQAKPAPDPSPRQSAIDPARDQALVANVSGTGNVVVGGQGNQVLSGVTAGGDLVLGDKVTGDQIAGDKFSGDKVLGDKNVYLPATERPTLPKGQTPHNLPSTGHSAAGVPGHGFVGRVEQLQKLTELMVPPGARSFLTGMGGIGKSELALQYAYTAMERYRGGILRLDARQGFEGMALEVISFVRGKFSGLIPNEGETKDLLSQCWSLWPATTNPPEQVLLILDDQLGNADGYGAEDKLCLGLPERFHRLITQREDAPTGNAQIDLRVLDPPAARELLAIQAGGDGEGRIAAEVEAATALCEAVGFLPLALVLLGARLSALPDLSLQELLEALRAKGAAARVLQMAHPELRADQGVVESQLVSWESLTIEAKELAILLALMAPAAIPWKLVERCWGGEPEETDPSELSDAQAQLLRSNLLERIQAGLYRLHPLVRDFLRLQAKEMRETSGQWRSRLAAAVAAVARLIPQNITLEQVTAVELFIPHLAQVAGEDPASLRDEDLMWPYTGLGIFYAGQGNYSSALPWCEKCLNQCEQRLGPDHPSTATSLNNLAELYRSQGSYAKAEPLYLRALAISEKALGPDHPLTATNLNNLALLYYNQGDFPKAEPLYLRALAIRGDALGPDHPDTANSLNNLALLYDSQGAYAKAEPLYLRAVAIREKALEPEHPDTAQSLNNLALLYYNQGDFPKAEPLFLSALTIYEKALGADHPTTATSLNNIAELYRSQGAYAKAETLYLRAVAIKEKALGPEHPDTAQSLNNLAALYDNQGAYAKAEPLYERALAIKEKALGPDHPATAQSLNNLAELYRSQGAYAKAEPLYERALAINEKALGPDHPATATSLNNLALLYYNQGDFLKAEPLYVRALAINEKALGPEHQNTQTFRKNLERCRAALGA